MNRDGNASNSRIRYVRGIGVPQKMMSKQRVFACDKNESDHWPRFARKIPACTLVASHGDGLTWWLIRTPDSRNRSKRA